MKPSNGLKPPLRMSSKSHNCRYENQSAGLFSGTTTTTHLGQDKVGKCLGLSLELVADGSVADDEVLNKSFEQHWMMSPEGGYLENTTVGSVHVWQRRGKEVKLFGGDLR